MVVVPPLCNVMRPVVESIVATDGFELLYVMAPVLADEGNVGVKGKSPRVLVRPPPVK